MVSKKLKLGFLDALNLVTDPLCVELNKIGVETTTNLDDTCDFLWNASVLRYLVSDVTANKYPNALVINYVWDFYEWAWEGKRKNEIYNWKEYGEYLKGSDEVWCPGEGTAKRLKEYLDIDAVVLHTGVSVEDRKTSDGGYVLNHLREYPEQNFGWAEKACKELGIEYHWPNHGLELEDWKDEIANCRFMICEYMEASTGGLTLLEGLWNGKPSLISDSPYQGGNEYLGPYANTFKWNSYKDCKEQIKKMWDNPPKIDIPEARKFIDTNFSQKTFALKIADRLKYLYENRRRTT